MNTTIAPPIPKEHYQLIGEAMAVAFDNTPWQVDAPLGAGLSSAALYKITTDSHTLVARLSNGDNLANEYEAATIVGQTGIGPRVYLADAERGILLMAFLAGVPLASVGMGRPEQVEKLGRFIRRLHDGQVFPGREPIHHRINQITPTLPTTWQEDPLIHQALQHLPQLVQDLDDPADLRPSHTDLNPNNLMYANDRFWLVDWEGASQQSLYFDLASCGNFFYYDYPALETHLLSAYFQRPPTSEETHKYYHMRRFVAVYYGCMFLYISRMMGATQLPDYALDTLPTYSEMMHKVAAGEANLGNPQTQQKLGLIYLLTASRMTNGW